jgi:hypothetical protein
LKIARPSIEEERWLVLASRYPALRAGVEATGGGGEWKTSTWMGRCLGFLLGLFATSLLAGALALFPSPLLVGGLLLLIAAEWLVARRRVVRSGIEETVYLCGALALATQLLAWSDASNVALGVALIAAAVLLAGWRLMNPLFTTLAAAGFSVAIALGAEKLLYSHLNTRSAGMACAVLAVAALVAGGRQWRRPSHDEMLDGLVITMPLLAFGWLVADGWGRNDSTMWMALALALGFLAMNIVSGVKRRQHAPLISALGNLVCATYALHVLFHPPLHWELIVAGGLLLLVAVWLDRRLRSHESGITSSKLAEPGLDLVQLAGAAHLVPVPGAPPAGVRGEGGDFGGGGASGRF